MLCPKCGTPLQTDFIEFCCDVVYLANICENCGYKQVLSRVG